jgi:signal transduction histidine kinase
MKVLLAIYFFIIATVQLGLLTGVYRHYLSQKLIRPSPYWVGSLAANVVALYTFGGGVIFVESTSRTTFNFTITNTLFYAAAVLQVLFCQSLNRSVQKTTRNYHWASIGLFAILFEILRLYGNYEMRTAFVCLATSMLYGRQFFLLGRARAQDLSEQLSYLQYTTWVELALSLGRIAILLSTSVTLEKVEDVSQVLILFTIAQFVMGTLSYIAIGGYWIEKISIAGTQALIENQSISQLLKEKEQLIHNLLRANKTICTGALSAAIAHELNQPLGANTLNIQFLKMKLERNELNSDVGAEALNQLESDNERASNIIRSLRSIFLEPAIDFQPLNLTLLIESVMLIVQPDLTKNNIKTLLMLPPNIVAPINDGEIRQVILNLLINAIQAVITPDQSHRKIIIETHVQADVVQFKITNSGLGIAADLQPHLFNLLNEGRKEGMGFGLWLCKHIIARHGGKIWYEDVRGGGARFVFELSLRPNEI